MQMGRHKITWHACDQAAFICFAPVRWPAVTLLAAVLLFFMPNVVMAETGPVDGTKRLDLSSGAEEYREINTIIHLPYPQVLRGCPGYRNGAAPDTAPVLACSEINTTTSAFTEDHNTRRTLRWIIFLAAGLGVLNFILFLVVWRVLKKFRKL